MPCRRPNRISRKLGATRKDSACRDASRERTYERSPNRSDLGPASRICDARVRLVAKPSGRVKVRTSRRLVAQHHPARSTEVFDRLHEPARTRALGDRNPRKYEDGVAVARPPSDVVNGVPARGNDTALKSERARAKANRRRRASGATHSVLGRP
jgi:hypothetical protein